MYLYIDPSQKDTIALRLFSKDAVIEYTQSGRNRELLSHVDAFLKEQDMQVGQLDGVAVVVGVGSFTDTRLAVTLANTLAYTCQIPVVTADMNESLDVVMQKIEQADVGVYISATYSGEPNIGPPKK